MNNHIPLPVMVERLEENRMPYGVLLLQNGMKSWLPGGEAAFLGLSSMMQAAGCCGRTTPGLRKIHLKHSLRAGTGNLGGDRMWIAPELQYSVTDRTNFFGSFRLQKQMDPGEYSWKRLKRMNGAWRWRSPLEAEVLAKGTKELSY